RCHTQVANSEHHSSHGPYFVQLLPCSRYPSWLRAMRTMAAARLCAAALTAGAASPAAAAAAGRAAGVAPTDGTATVSAAAVSPPTSAVPASRTAYRALIWTPPCCGSTARASPLRRQDAEQS